LGLPVAFDIIFSQKRPLLFIFWSLFSFVIIAAPLATVDSLYYGKFVLAPLNILRYNVFGKGGPDLYGEKLFSSPVMVFSYVIKVTVEYTTAVHLEKHLCTKSATFVAI